ncbi:aromatic acid/H+ symport family MFS transporter [Streptomyces sp. J2-1]|uniref:MFS transporter n=1 Tax=Streptomyces corallincola TaxID=2851888 RepID=UPI001C380312|nr:aromatic acid/H+ symport family MFS transporter [Streptomyces corallincola]MBV2353899.1 aromatic acid/H+ symport family MFS transporter [Streptomyces corallincola]
MSPTRLRTHAWTVVALCTLVVIVEGYDLIVYGALLPDLLKEPGWHLTRADAGAVGSYVYAGMLFGALAGGRLCDRFGRRPFINASVAWFAVWTFVCATAQAPWELSLYRFLAGLGMGAVIPAALALAKEHSKAGRTALVSNILMGGVPLGGSAAALIAQSVLPTHGWRTMFVIGGVFSVVVLAGCVALLPESQEFKDRVAAAALAPADGTPAGRRPRASDLFRGSMLVLTVLFALATFTNMLTWYGINTWLTSLMQELHYPLTSALRFSMTMNLGAVIGSFVAVACAHRWGSRTVAMCCALMTAAGIVGLALRPDSTAGLMALVVVVGVGGQSSLTMLLASVADAYPARLRGSAIGWSNGLGRTGAILAPSLGGWVLAAGLGPGAVFGTFAATSACSAVVLFALALLGRSRRREADEAPTAPGTLTEAGTHS